MDISRCAILIGNNTGYKAPTFLSGVNHDLRNYMHYLASDIGGNWNLSTEVRLMHNCNRRDILSAIRQCASDYSFIVYSGHGFESSNNGETYICVRDGYISESELDTQLDRQSLILDCCREVENVFEGFAGIGDTLVKGDRVFSTARQIQDARIKFDFALSKSSPGRFIGYACLTDETSSDNPMSGGAFSTALINIGKRFGSIDNPRGFWLPIKLAVENAAIELNNDPLTNQSPTFRLLPSNMRLTHPFAITNKVSSPW